MFLLQRKNTFFGTVDGSPLRPDLLAVMSIEQINSIELDSDRGTVRLEQLFDVSTDSLPHEPFLVVDGDCERLDLLGKEMVSGTLCVLGNIGDRLGQSLRGGTIVVSGNAMNHVGSDMSNGLIYIAGNCEHFLASPIPGKKSGMRGGDILVAGNVGDRACERMRRGTVFVAGDAGAFCAPQMIAGTLVVMGKLGRDWAGGMRRGSLVLGQDYTTEPTASLSEPRDFELSFLPLVWRHVERVQNEAIGALTLSVSFSTQSLQRTARQAPGPIKIPRTRWVQRQIADLCSSGRGEVLVLRRISSPAYQANELLSLHGHTRQV